ncbi:MAG: MiaB/RimO family radical SAM methylthiotransferase [Patescibacteria group bacterium]
MGVKNNCYWIYTYGCQMNEADSLWLEKIFKHCDYRKATSLENADVVLINTCSVRQAAEDKVYGLAPKIQEFKIKNSNLKIILTGCMVGSATGKRRRMKLASLKERIPWVDYFISPDTIFKNLPQILNNTEKSIHPALQKPQGVVVEETEKGKGAYVPIMRGCNNFCSYCVVPYARGEEKYRKFEDVVQDVKNLVKKGVKSVTLLGQNVNSYPNFAKLLKKLHTIKVLEEIWFITSNPWDFPEELIDVLALPKIRKYLHLAVQSGDDEILRKMNRPYTANEYKELVKRIRKKVPEMKFGTDLLVGFPGETKKQFENTVKLVKDVGFENAFIAMYSPRPGTAAAENYEDNVPRQEKKRRHHKLSKIIETGQ